MVTHETASYKITRLVIGEPRAISISETEFNEIATARERLVTMLALEEKLQYVLENFAEYEGELLRLSVKQMVWTVQDWSVFRTAMHGVNRRVVNLLSTTRLYLDQVQYDLSGMYGKESAQFAGLRARISAEYDAEIAYRAMEALRNHVQHRAMPVQSMSFPLEVVGEDEQEKFKFSVVPALVLSKLRENKDFKASVLNELTSLAGKKDQIQLSPLIRVYVESICKIHEELRRLTDSDVQKWEATIQAARDKAQTLFTETNVGLAIVARRADCVVIKKAYLHDHIETERRRLRKRNSLFTGFAKRYVSSETKD